MNEWTFYWIFLHWVPPCRHENNNIMRLDFFNRASLPVIICFSFFPPCPPLAERTWAGSGILVYLTPALIMHQSNPSPLPPHFFWAGPPIPYPIFDYIYFCTEMTLWPYPWPYDHMTIPYRLVITFFLTRIGFRSPPVTLLRSLLLFSTLYLTTKLTPSIFPAFFAYFYFFPIFETATLIIFTCFYCL
jgi:hypothetical protein